MLCIHVTDMYTAAHVHVHATTGLCRGKVAHNYQVQVSPYVTDELGILFIRWKVRITLIHACLWSILFLHIRHKQCDKRIEEDNSRGEQVGRSELVPTVV